MKKRITTDKAPQADHILSQAITASGLIFVSGQVHVRPDNSLVEGTVKAKLAQIMSNIENILHNAGAELSDIVKATVYVTNMDIMPELNESYPGYFSEPYPAREAICVTKLPLGADIEISVIAVSE